MKHLTILAVLLIAVGCKDRQADQMPTSPEIEPTQPVLSTAAEAAATCAPTSLVKARPVAVGQDVDFNENGIVCDENHGTEEHPLIFTVDDVPAPAIQSAPGS